MLRQASSTLMCMFLRRSQLLSELFIHRRHSEATGKAKASHMALWMVSTNRPVLVDFRASDIRTEHTPTHR